LLSIEGLPFCSDSGKHPNPTPKGRPFILRRITVHVRYYFTFPVSALLRRYTPGRHSYGVFYWGLPQGYRCVKIVGVSPFGQL
jgi:hypothetical protein